MISNILVEEKREKERRENQKKKDHPDRGPKLSYFFPFFIIKKCAGRESVNTYFRSSRQPLTENPPAFIPKIFFFNCVYIYDVSKVLFSPQAGCVCILRRYHTLVFCLGKEKRKKKKTEENKEHKENTENERKKKKMMMMMMMTFSLL